MHFDIAASSYAFEAITLIGRIHDDNTTSGALWSIPGPVRAENVPFVIGSFHKARAGGKK